jgi:uncharacterized protein (DUF983 family)
MATAADEREPKKDTVREGSTLTCPHCGEKMEVVDGKLVKGGDRSLYTQAVAARK